MKKITAALLAAVLAFGLWACGSKSATVTAKISVPEAKQALWEEAQGDIAYAFTSEYYTCVGYELSVVEDDGSSYQISGTYAIYNVLNGTTKYWGIEGRVDKMTGQAYVSTIFGAVNN